VGIELVTFSTGDRHEICVLSKFYPSLFYTYTREESRLRQGNKNISKTNITNKLIDRDEFFVCLFILFRVARAICQLSGHCHHYWWQGCKFRPKCLALTAFSNEGPITCHNYCDTGPPFLRSYPIRIWTKLSRKKVNFINSSENEGLSPSCIALFYDGFGSLSWHSIWFFRLFYSFHNFLLRISNFFGLSTTEEIWLVEMRIWCIKIGIVLVLHPKDPWFSLLNAVFLAKEQSLSI
jgi:hypothetical protein